MSLPIELIDRIVFHVSQRSDLATLRLTSHTLNAIATPYYFATIPMLPDSDVGSVSGCLPSPNRIEHHTRYFSSILNSEKLRKLVRKVEIYFCNPDYVNAGISKPGCLLSAPRTAILTTVCIEAGCQNRSGL
ncbi:hypothetical protein PMIN06_002387 [Paraphaeosphaeria minitans]